MKTKQDFCSSKCIFSNKKIVSAPLDEMQPSSKDRCLIELCNTHKYCFSLTFLWVCGDLKQIKSEVDLKQRTDEVLDQHRSSTPEYLPKTFLDQKGLIEEIIDIKSLVWEQIDSLVSTLETGILIFCLSKIGSEDEFNHAIGYRKKGGQYKLMDTDKVPPIFILNTKDELVNYIFRYIPAITETLKISLDQVDSLSFQWLTYAKTCEKSDQNSDFMPYKKAR